MTDITRAESWERIQEVFLGAADLPRPERAAYLDRACEGEPRLRQQVASLLEVDGETMSPLQSAVGKTADSLLSATVIGARLGPWRVLREIGRGGMGSVYLATRDDDQYRQEVAIKLIRRGMDTEDVLDRFRHERQILATLEHPYIARLLDAGTGPDGRPFLVMEYVQGQALDKYCAERKLSIRQRCELFLKVCDAVSHAHRKLVIHRDLKPANIFVTADGTPKLLDFGVAKLLHPDRLAEVTSFDQRPLTPYYASPEQVRAEPMTTATDVYSLGAILYELLSGVRAHRFTTLSPSEIEQEICETDPPLPSEAAPELRKQLRGDPDAIVAMAIRKEPERRYSSIEQLAADVRSYLEARPVVARGGSFAYSASRYLRRHRWSIAVATALLLTLAGGTAAATWEAIRASRQQALAERERGAARESEIRARSSQVKAEASRRNAEAQAAEAERQRADANEQRQLANQRFEQVRQLAGKFLLDFHDSIAMLPGSIPARKMVVETGLRYYDTLVRDAAGNSELLREIARGYDRLGDVQGNPYYANLGDLAGASASYAKAYAIRARVPDRSAAFLAERIQGSVRRAQALLPGADYKGCEAVIGEALAIPLSDAAGKNPEVRMALAGAWGMLGDIKLREGLADKAIDPYSRQLALSQQLLAESDSPARQRGVSLAQAKLGDAYLRMREQANALPHLRIAFGIDQRLSEAEPENVNMMRKLLITTTMLSSVLASPVGQALAAPGELNRYLEMSVGMADKLAGANPDSRQPLLDIGLASDNLGDWLRSQKKPQEALAAYRKAAAAVEQMNRLSPQAPGNVSMLVQVYQRIALGMTDTGQFAEGMENLRLAERHLARAEEANPGLPMYVARRAELKQTKAGLYAGQGAWREAVAAYREALEIMELQHKALPANQTFLNEQPGLLASLASCLEKAGDHAAAVAALRGALERFGEIESKRALAPSEVEERKRLTARLEKSPAAQTQSAPIQ